MKTICSNAYLNFGLGHMTLLDRYPSGTTTPLCSRYASRMGTSRFVSAVWIAEQHLHKP